MFVERTPTDHDQKRKSGGVSRNPLRLSLLNSPETITDVRQAQLPKLGHATSTDDTEQAGSQKKSAFLTKPENLDQETANDLTKASTSPSSLFYDDLLDQASLFKYQLQAERDKVSFLRIRNSVLLDRLLMIGAFDDDDDHHHED